MYVQTGEDPRGGKKLLFFFDGLNLAYQYVGGKQWEAIFSNNFTGEIKRKQPGKNKNARHIDHLIPLVYAGAVSIVGATSGG